MNPCTLHNPLVVGIHALGEVGIEFPREKERFYPQLQLAAHVLGYVHPDGHGVSGMERAMDADLIDPKKRLTPSALSVDIRVQAALERVPASLLQASADLGARPRQTFLQVTLPLAVPGIAAGSIFTFSLTLGDFIVPQLVGPPGYFIGSMVYAQQGAIGNLPMAAAFTLVPIVLIAVYLSIVKRLGAFDAL